MCCLCPCSRQKLDNSSVKCIFVGYRVEYKGYRLYDPLTENLLVSRDIIFDEQNQWEWKEVQLPPFMIADDPMDWNDEQHCGMISCPQRTPILTRPLASSSPLSNSSSSSDSPPKKMGSLKEIYAICQFTQVVEPKKFEEAMKFKE